MFVTPSNYLLDGDNKWYEDVGYGFGALANVNDIVALGDGTNVKVNAADPKKDWWSHSSITGGGGQIDVSVGPASPVDKWSSILPVRGDGNYFGYENSSGTWSTEVYNVNSKILTNITNTYKAGNGLLWGKLYWNTFGLSCVNQTSTALWLSGVPTLPINFHPYILNLQLTIRQLGIYSSAYTASTEL